jgi:hypothetical protein
MIFLPEWSAFSISVITPLATPDDVTEGVAQDEVLPVETQIRSAFSITYSIIYN